MHRTIFQTPGLRPVMRVLSQAYLRLMGWRCAGALPAEAQKCVLIAAPHTTNWDLPNTLTTAFVLNLNVYWMGKSSLFRPPFGGVMRWLGGIAVNRQQSNNLVAAAAEALGNAAGAVQLIVPPEGTRSEVRVWKTGFYHIAVGAKVPIVLAYIDYADKVCGLGPVFHPTGNIEADMAWIKAFYAPFRGRRSERIRPD